MRGEIKDVLLLDVIPFSVGIDTQGGRFEVLIPKNYTIPTRRSMILSTVHPGQSSAYVHLLVGESLWAWENSTLGGLKIDVVPGPKGVAEIEVTADVLANGVLHVSARDCTSGSEKSARIGVPAIPTREESLRLAIESPRKAGP